MEHLFDIDFSIIGIISGIIIGFAETLGAAVTDVIVGVAEQIVASLEGFGV